MDRNRNYAAQLDPVCVALRKESVDRNTGDSVLRIFTNGSLSARRAWIEIFAHLSVRPGFQVALRKESVDRNLLGHCRDSIFKRVALRKESVDRNICNLLPCGCVFVALRKESVDRNFVNVARAADRVLSLSARRAWIEIWW